MKLAVVGTKRAVTAFLDRVAIEQTMLAVELRMLDLACRCQERAAERRPL